MLLLYAQEAKGTRASSRRLNSVRQTFSEVRASSALLVRTFGVDDVVV